jgi:cytochrome c oxidase subunit 2
VVGKQWMWKVQHPEGKQEINELHIPVGYPVKLLMTSQDVIHSFSVPAFRIKQDVLPGRYTTEWFQATQPGEYHLFCTQYCGTSHSAMVGRIVAMTPMDYQRWLGGGTAAAAPAATAVATAVAPTGGAAAAKALNPAMVAAGEKLFKEFGCISCHKSDHTGQGPALEGLFGKTVQLEGGKSAPADETYIRESILQPNAKIVKGYKPIMPTFEGQLEPEELNQLITYIESMKVKK